MFTIFSPWSFTLLLCRVVCISKITVYCLQASLSVALKKGLKLLDCKVTPVQRAHFASHNEPRSKRVPLSCFFCLDPDSDCEPDLALMERLSSRKWVVIGSHAIAGSGILQSPSFSSSGVLLPNRRIADYSRWKLVSKSTRFVLNCAAG